jgi:phosphomethylpyrimidine synthase
MNGRITPEMACVAEKEGCDPSALMERIARGHVVIPRNKRHNINNICGIGKGLATKVNANIGASSDPPGLDEEISKLRAAVSSGTDTVMDLSIGKGIRPVLKRIIEGSSVPVGTVPIYEVASDIISRGSIKDMRWGDIEKVLIGQAEMGVDFFTIHAGVTMEIVGSLKKRERILDVVSRGGSFIVDWIIENGRENPFYSNFDRLLDIAKEHDVTLSLGDGMRPGALKDAGDEPQVQELVTLGRMDKRERQRGGQVRREREGHVPMDQIGHNVALEKSLCSGAPFYVLGPLVTDAAPGYDHIVGAIGGAIAAMYGADFLCYVTASEHLRLPSVDDVKEGVIASRIAAHAADIAKGVKGAMDRDIAISRARRVRDWKSQFSLALDRSKPVRYREDSRPKSGDVCSMCNEFCPIKIGGESLKK